MEKLKLISNHLKKYGGIRFNNSRRVVTVRGLPLSKQIVNGFMEILKLHKKDRRLLEYLIKVEAEKHQYSEITN